MHLIICKKTLYLTFYAMLLLWFFLSPPVPAKTKEDADQLQDTAINLSKNWNKTDYRKSIELFRKASQIQLKTNQFDKAAECLRKSAHLLFLLSENEKAENTLNEALEIDLKNNNLAGRAKTLSLLAEIKFTAGNDESEKLITEAISLGKTANDDSARALSLLVYSTFLFQKDSPELTLATILEALNYAEKTTDSSLIAKTLSELSYAYFKLGKYQLALESAQKSLLNWQKTEDLRNITLAQKEIGFHYRKLGEQQAALTQLLAAEKSFPVDMDFIERSRLIATIGAIYGDFGETKLEEFDLCL